MGVWIEITMVMAFIGFVSVAPLVGVWIEIAKDPFVSHVKVVAPLVGVWIEIAYLKQVYWTRMSLPTREYGLKLLSPAQ